MEGPSLLLGTLHHGSLPVSFAFGDRALAHLQVVILAKLRRGEGFGFHIPADATLGRGRLTLWTHPSTPLTFTIRNTAEVTINAAWVRALMEEANSNRGLSLLPESPADPSTS
ncbi:hypothetical protein EDF43_111184 [Rathayibacter sp. PhB179]|nr:hypothetical protein EDF49_11112 [Rathayibacter sp. PhB192]TCM25356.1 hypothetical protein EDF43_111184 [Rathayibacter sp. PhB179]